MGTSARRAFYIFLVAATVGITVVHNRAVSEGRSSPVGQVVLSILSPGQKAIHAVKRGVNSFRAGFADARRLSEENARLKRKCENVQTLQIRIKELERENARLKALLGYKARHTHVIPATAVAESGSPWARTVVLDRGYRDGVRVKDVAVTERGVVGQVWSVVSPNSSLLVLLTDTNSGIGALVQRSRAVGIVKGRGQDLPVLTYLDQNADVKPGDVVITSGRGGVYPKGLPIGTVVRIIPDRGGSGKQAEVKPFADLSQLEELLLVRGGEEVAERPGT
jgi:rod shape-determining protein MreC